MKVQSICFSLLAGLAIALATPILGSVEARTWHRYAHGKYAMSHVSRYRGRHISAWRARHRWHAAQAATAPAAKLTPQPGQPPLKLLTRAEILASDPSRLERLGRRLIVGFQSFADVKALVEKRAVSGVFITDHNVRDQKVEDIAKNIQDLQNVRRVQGLPRLIVAADQEGGYVSRLSPPLKSQPPLGDVIAKIKSDEEREKAVRNYAETQARELDRLGITMNFGPVVDLRLGSASRDDGETRTYWRAIDSDPFVVANVASWYCDTLTKFNIICTLKHFPGLGRVSGDTHVAPAEITANESQLELNDWVPFRRLMGRPGVATMVGHVRIDAVDKSTPASYSDLVVNKLLRPRWESNGLLITDDLGMGAITKSKDGIGGAAIKAVNAGVDLILLASAEQDFDIVMSALLEADGQGQIARTREKESDERLKKYVFVDDREPSPAAAVELPAPPPQSLQPARSGQQN